MSTNAFKFFLPYSLLSECIHYCNCKHETEVKGIVLPDLSGK